MQLKAMWLKKHFSWVLLLFTVISLCFPVRVLAAENGGIGSLLTKAKNIYENSLSKVSNYKIAKTSELQTRIKSYRSIVEKKCIISLCHNLDRILVNTEEAPSQLQVKMGGKKDVEMMINKFSSKPYYVDDNGYVFGVPGATENLSKSCEYSMVIDSLINGTKPTKILANKQIIGVGLLLESEKNHILLMGARPFTFYKTDKHSGDTVLAHELIHCFRREKNLQPRLLSEQNIAEEEACTIGLENLIRHQNGFSMRGDGSGFEDVNKDGIPDGNGRYGEYLNTTTGPNWFNVYQNSTSKL